MKKRKRSLHGDKTGHDRPRSASRCWAVSKRARRRLALGAVLCLVLLGLAAVSWPRRWHSAAPPRSAAADIGQAVGSAPAEPTRRDAAASPAPTREAPLQPLPAEPAAATRAAIEQLRREEIHVAEQLLKDFPGTVEGMILLGNVHTRQGNSAAAVKWWSKCLEANPRRADAYGGLAGLAFQKGEYERAASLWRQALQILPNMAGAHNGLARALLSLGRIREAVAALQADLRISPRATLSHFLLAQSYLQLEEYQKAKENYEAVIRLQPDHWNAYYGLATVCARLGQPEKAAEFRHKFKELKAAELQALIERVNASDDLLAMRQGVAHAHTAAGAVYQQRESLLRAEQHWQRAAELDPKNVLCRRGLLALYQAGNQQGEALAISRQIAEIESVGSLSQTRH